MRTQDFMTTPGGNKHDQVHDLNLTISKWTSGLRSLILRSVGVLGRLGLVNLLRTLGVLFAVVCTTVGTTFWYRASKNQRSRSHKQEPNKRNSQEGNVLVALRMRLELNRKGSMQNQSCSDRNLESCKLRRYTWKWKNTMASTREVERKLVRNV